MISPATVQMLAALLFVAGLAVFLLRRNVFFLLMGVELMLNAANLSFVGYGRMHGSASGQVATLFVMALAAAEACVFLALIIAFFRSFGSIDIETAKAEPEEEAI